ncbi:MAG: hypothetical protein P8X81_06955 [Woeseiaceae bacterium]|jgi:hypothetical protein
MLDLDGLRKELIRCGIAPRHVRRTVSELSDHYDDLVEEALHDGASRIEAHAHASRKIGEIADIGAAVRARPELRSWAYRFPRVAAVVYPLTFVALLPAAPVFLGYAYGGYVIRWVACLMLSAIVTATMFLVLQLAITLT